MTQERDGRPLRNRPYRYVKYRQLKEVTDRVIALNPDLSEGIKDRLPSWIRQIHRRRKKLSVPLMFSILTAFSRSVVNDSESVPIRVIRDRLRFAMRIAALDSDSTTVGHLMAEIGTPPHRWGVAFSHVKREASRRFQERVAAAANANQLSESVRHFIGYLSEVTGYRRVPVRFDATPDATRPLDSLAAARATIRAYTDGSVIHLPACLASTDSKDLNQAFLACYLAAHEFLHMAAGSFEFSFKSPRGRRLFRQLRPMRSQMKHRFAVGGISQELRSKLESEGINLEAIGIETPPDIVKLFYHFPNSGLAQWLLNAAEDGRLETLIKRRWPGLAHINRAHGAIYEAEVSPSPLASSASENLTNAIGMYAADRLLNVRLTRDHRACFEKAKRIVEKQRQLSRQSVYDSIATARKLYVLLEKQLSEELEQADYQNRFQPEIDIEEIAVRLIISQHENEKKTYDRDGSSDSDESFEVKDPGVWFPEWDGDELVERQSHVRVHPFQPTVAYPLLTPLALPFPSLEMSSTRRMDGFNRRWNEDGPYLASERFAEYRAQRRAGLNDMILNYDLRRTQPPLKVTLLFDLSISMEAPRHCLEGDTAISRAIQAGVWIATNLESQGVEVSAYGAIDGGLRFCQLFELPKPVSRHIPSLRCVGAGGFRLGAFIRAISAAPAELGMQRFNGRHIVLAMMDGDGGYFWIAREGIIESLHKNNCPTCTSRHRCRVEAARGGIDIRPNMRSLFQPKGYDLGDIANAVMESEVELRMLMFNDQVSRTQLDTVPGITDWSVCLNPDDLVSSAPGWFGEHDIASSPRAINS